MAWETRGGRRYFYEARREGGRVVKVCHGPEGSARAELAAWEAHRQRDEVRARLDQKRQARQEERDEDAALSALLADSLSLARALIESEGFHRPGRGRWRRKRGGEGMGEKANNPAAAVLREAIAEGKQRQARREGFDQLTDAAKALHLALEPGASAEQLHAAALVLRSDPGAARKGFDSELGYVSDLIDGGLRLAVRRAAGFDMEQAKTQVMLCAADQEAEELAGWGASLAVRMLARRAVATKYHLGAIEGRYMLELAASDRLRQPLSDKRREFFEKRIERTQRMHLAALKALIDAQRIPLPTVQIATTAGVSVNVGGPAGQVRGAET